MHGDDYTYPWTPEDHAAAVAQAAGTDITARQLCPFLLEGSFIYTSYYLYNNKIYGASLM